ncbi:MAG TPA: aminotransferase class V-fold PLP-dependent enzyme, partial [Saprospiraceae bacterium]|nr:aminotransferase class V-fold PLP-dependent enzyme [Saprospiraceae bacterium]
QTIKAGLSIRLKEEMGVENIEARENEMVKIIWDRLSKIKKLHILAPENSERLGVFSFYIEGLHYNLGVKLLNDKFGIQTRGGCSCAGTYGHYLLNIDEKKSHEITDKVNEGKLSYKPGWIRMSVHPTMTDEEIIFILDALEELSDNFEKWGKDYYYVESNNEFYHETNEKSLFTDFFDKI